MSAADSPPIFHSGQPGAWMKPESFIEKCLHDEINRILPHLTEAQREFFDRLYPRGLGVLGANKLRTALFQCQATLTKNAQGRK